MQRRIRMLSGSRGGAHMSCEENELEDGNPISENAIEHEKIDIVKILLHPDNAD